MTHRRTPLMLPSTVLLAGFTFLVYEVSWFRMLALMVGATVAASTVTLVAFMAGLGAGALFFGRRVAAGADPARLAALLLAGCGLLGLASGPAFRDGLPALYAALAAAGFGVDGASALALAAALAALLPPAFLMGGFLPAMAGLLVRDGRTLAADTGRLYAAETLGSTLGALSTGFLLIRLFGQAHTLHLAAALDLLLAALLLAATRRLPPADTAAEEEAPRPAPAAARGKKGAPAPLDGRRAALLSAFVFGLAVGGLQIAWFRILRVYLANTSYTFALVAALVIAGLAAGGALFSRRGRTARASADLAPPLLYAAGAALLGFLLLTRMPELLMFPLLGDGGTPAARLLALPAAAALLAILPVTLLSGYAFPLACTLHTPAPRDIAGGLGRIYAASTLGALLGPPLAAFALIPAKGAAVTLLLFAACLLGAGIALFSRPAPAAVATALALALLACLPVVRVAPPSIVRFHREILKYRETVEGTWLVARGGEGSPAAVSAYVNNSAVIGSTYDAVKAVKLVGHLPFLAGLKARRALVVGFGIGVTASAIAAHPEVERIDCVELVAGLTEAAGFYAALNGNVQNDPRLHVRSGDGRHFLQATGETYDLISSDPTHPVLGSNSLYTREYFDLCRRRLNPGGMVSQYLPVHKLRLDDLLSIVKTFRSVFPGTTVWLGHSHLVLLGAEAPPALDFPAWAARTAALPADQYFYVEPHHLAACLLLDAAAIDAFPPHLPLNTDDRPLGEFFDFAAFDEGNTAVNLAWLNDRRVRVTEHFTATPDPARLERFEAGNRHLTEGIVRDLAGDRAGFLAKLEEAHAANPENEEYPFLVKYFR